MLFLPLLFPADQFSEIVKYLMLAWSPSAGQGLPDKFTYEQNGPQDHAMSGYWLEQRPTVDRLASYHGVSYLCVHLKVKKHVYLAGMDYKERHQRIDSLVMQVIKVFVWHVWSICAKGSSSSLDLTDGLNPDKDVAPTGQFAICDVNKKSRELSSAGFWW